MAIQSFTHPAFGRCELIPSVLAIKWRTEQGEAGARSALGELTLAPAREVPKVEGAARGARDPRAVRVNESSTLSWGTGKRLTDAAIERLRGGDNVEWVARVYRAAGADDAPQSWFAVNPTVLIVAAEAATTVMEQLSLLDSAVSLDEGRNRTLKGRVGIRVPNANAIELRERLVKSGAAAAADIRFENIPYLSPTTGCCGEAPASNATGACAETGDCSPSLVSLIPDDSFFAQQWGLQRIGAPRAWPLSEGDPNVVVAVLDQGVELAHPDLNLWPVSYSTITHTNDGSPVGNHGTACAGIIGARIGNGLGVAGLAGNCRVMAIATNFADTEVAEGLYFAADNGARVVSMSFGVYPSWMVWDFSIIEAALQYCDERNVVLCAATGNENQAVSRFPATDPRTIGVGGSNRDDVRKSIGDASIEAWWGACYGPDVDVVAPCLEIPTTDRLGAAGYTPTDYDMRFNGTSSATPHVSALAGLILSVNPGLTSREVRRIIAETCDKISPGIYAYVPTAGKPDGAWNDQVGYGRINAERALLVACACGREPDGECGVRLRKPDPCCVSPCDPPWRPDAQCLVSYETRLFRAPVSKRGDFTNAAGASGPYVEFRIVYQHKLCLLGKQHGPLLYTVTLLPGEKVTLYHSERYRRITTEEQRFSVHTSFMQFLSLVHEARITDRLDALAERLASAKGSSSGTSGGGFFGGLFGFGGSSSSSGSVSVTDHTMLSVSHVAQSFNQSVLQASQLTEAERSLVVSTFEEKDQQDVSSRVIQNTNDCRAVTYFVRRVMELYSASTVVAEISYRVIAPNVPAEWHLVGDVAWLPQALRDLIAAVAALLPKVGTVTEMPRPVSIPTDGAVYDPELAHCGSCEPQREAAVMIRLEQQKAEAMLACLRVKELELELERRRLLLDKGQLGPFEPAAPAPAPAPGG